MAKAEGISVSPAQEVISTVIGFGEVGVSVSGLPEMELGGVENITAQLGNVGVVSETGFENLREVGVTVFDSSQVEDSTRSRPRVNSDELDWGSRLLMEAREAGNKTEQKILDVVELLMSPMKKDDKLNSVNPLCLIPAGIAALGFGLGTKVGRNFLISQGTELVKRLTPAFFIGHQLIEHGSVLLGLKDWQFYIPTLAMAAWRTTFPIEPTMTSEGKIEDFIEMMNSEAEGEEDKTQTLILKLNKAIGNPIRAALGLWQVNTVFNLNLMFMDSGRFFGDGNWLSTVLKVLPGLLIPAVIGRIGRILEKQHDKGRE